MSDSAVCSVQTVFAFSQSCIFIDRNDTHEKNSINGLYWCRGREDEGTGDVLLLAVSLRWSAILVQRCVVVYIINNKT